MATTIANLRILLSANTKGLKAPLAGAKADLNGFKNSAMGAGAGLKAMVPQLLAVAGAAISVKVAISAIADSLKKLDQIGKLSSRLGVSAEALQKLRFAGELTGVSITTMDMAIQRWVKNSAKAASGSKELGKIFAELGLDAKELIRLPLDKQMEQFADALQAVPLQADRVRIAAALLDSEGVALIQTLQGGSDALSKMFKDADTSGIFSEEDIKRAEAANDAMLRVSKSIEFVIGQIAVELADDIENLIMSFEELGITGSEAGRQIGIAFKALAQTMATASLPTQSIGLLFTKILGSDKQFADARERYAKTLDIIKGVKREVDDVAAGITPDIGALTDIPDAEIEVDAKLVVDEPSLRDLIGDVSAATSAASERAKIGGPASLLKGSLAAFSVIQGSARKDHFVELIAQNKTSLTEEKKQTKELKKISSGQQQIYPAKI